MEEWKKIQKTYKIRELKVIDFTKYIDTNRSTNY